MPCCKRNGGACAARTDPCEPMSMWSIDPCTRSGQVACSPTFHPALYEGFHSSKQRAHVQVDILLGLSTYINAQQLVVARNPGTVSRHTPVRTSRPGRSDMLHLARK